MAIAFVTSLASGVSLFTKDSTPNGIDTAPRGSFLLRTDLGNVSLWLNLDGATAWGRVFSPGATGIVDLTSDTALLLVDNTAAAIDIGSTGLTNLLRFSTLNGAERIAYNGVLSFLINTGGLTITAGGLTVTAGAVSFPANTVSLALSVAAAPTGVVGTPLTLNVTYAAGASSVDTVLPVRAGGFKVYDVHIVSGGATGGTVTVQTAGGAAAVSNAMVPGNATLITRTTLLDNTVFASGATIRVAVAAGAPLGNCYIALTPL